MEQKEIDRIQAEIERLKDQEAVYQKEVDDLKKQQLYARLSIFAGIFLAIWVVGVFIILGALIWSLSVGSKIKKAEASLAEVRRKKENLRDKLISR